MSLCSNPIVVFSSIVFSFVVFVFSSVVFSFVVFVSSFFITFSIFSRASSGRVTLVDSFIATGFGVITFICPILVVTDVSGVSDSALSPVMIVFGID